MMHSLLQSIAAGAVSGSPGSGGPNLQLLPQMMQPMSLAPPTNPQTMPFAPFSMMPYGGLPNFGNPMSLMPYGGLANFGNATSGALMPLMAQNSMPSSLPEPQPARAAAAAATTPAAAPLTNLHSTGTRPQSHSRRSRSRHRRRRHSHSHTSHQRGHDKAPRRHTTRRAHSSSRSHSPSRPHRRSRRSHHNLISLRSRSPRRRSSPRRSPAPKTTAPHRAPQTHTSQGSTSWRTSGWDTDKSQRSSPRWWNQSWGHQPQSHNASSWGKHRHSTSNTGNWSSQDKRQSWPQQHPRHQPQAPSCAGHNNASTPPSPAPAAAFPTPPPRPAPPHPSPQHPLDDAKDLDPPPSKAEPGTNSDNQWLDLWRSVMDTAKTDPMRVPTPRELGELGPLPALDISRMEQTNTILRILDPALPPSHADLLAECWELRTMDMDEPIAFDPSFYHLLGRESHGMVTTWFPRPHPWPVPGGQPEAGSSFPSRCHVCTRHHPGSNAPHVL